MKISCIIDCRIDIQAPNDFLTLGIWGKPCFEYICDTISSIEGLDKVYLLTDSPKITSLAAKYNFLIAATNEDIHEDVRFFVSGRAMFLTKQTIQKAISTYTEGKLLACRKVDNYTFDNAKITKDEISVVDNAFYIYDTTDSENIVYYMLDNEEALTVNSIYDFELALILKKKQIGRDILTKSILDRIEKKKINFADCCTNRSICLVGHSQLDNWECKTINGQPVRNCGIRGISSVEYENYILKNKLLNCASDTYIVMHGTNDIVYPYTDEEIIESISHTFEYIISNNPSARILFLLVAHCNGRLDRSNKRINTLNKKLKAAFEKHVQCVSLSALDDEFGELKSENTVDGLHFSDAGYDILIQIVEHALNT